MSAIGNVVSLTDATQNPLLEYRGVRGLFSPEWYHSFVEGSAMSPIGLIADATVRQVSDVGLDALPLVQDTSPKRCIPSWPRKRWGCSPRTLALRMQSHSWRLLSSLAAGLIPFSIRARSRHVLKRSFSVQVGLSLRALERSGEPVLPTSRGSIQHGGKGGWRRIPELEPARRAANRSGHVIPRRA